MALPSTDPGGTDEETGSMTDEAGSAADTRCAVEGRMPVPPRTATSVTAIDAPSAAIRP
jgi:hypothetical protein